jgi:hypothetical protein
MTTRIADGSPNVWARVAGFLYLVPLAPFGLLYVPSLVVQGDPAATVEHLLAHESTVRLSVVSALLSQVGFIFVVFGLHRVFRPVNETMSRLMVVFCLLGVPVAMLAALTHIAVLILLNDYRAAFTTEQVQSLVSLLLDLGEQALNVADIFWGLWLLPMGYLAFKAEFLPRFMKGVGVLLMTVGCFGYLAQSLFTFLLPNVEVNIVMRTAWVELFLPLWLLIRGVNVEKWRTVALEAATA